MKNIIFDLDGTLWDPTNIILKAWEETLNSFNELNLKVTKNDLKNVFGMQDSLIGKTLFPHLNTETVNKVMEKCYSMENSYISQYGGDLYPGLEEVLIELSKSYDLYIVSNCQSGYIEAFFKYHKLSKYFKDFECSGNTGNPKGDNIRDIIERNELTDCVYIGDTQGDKDGADQNDIPFIYAEYGFKDLTFSKYSISSINKLPKLLVSV